MKRQLALIDFALGGLRRRLGKSLALTVGLAFVIALFGSALLLTDALRAEYARGTGGMPDLTVQRLVAGRPALIDVSVSEEIAALPAVRRVTPRVWGYYFFVALEANVTVVGATEAHVLEDGRLPTEDGEVTVGASIADLLGLRVGDEIGIPVQGEVQFSEVVGVFGEDAAIRTADLVVATPTHARRLLGMPEGSATDLAIDLTTQDEASVLTERIGALVPGARVLDARLLERTYELTFDTRGGLLALLFLPALAAFLLLAWERLTGLGRDERREIGVLKAVGWGTGDVLAARMWESAIVGVFGATLGGVLAYVYVFWLDAPGLLDALLGWSALRPPMRLVPSFDPVQAFALLASVVIPFVAISVVPAWRASMIDPDQALRGGE